MTMEPLTNKPTDQELIEKCESHINALRYEGYNWKELAELLTRFKSLTENRSELLPKAPENWYNKDEMYWYLKRHHYSEEIAKELSQKWADDLQSAFEKGYDKCNNEYQWNTRHESAKTGVEVWQILDAVKDCSSFEDISNTNESCCDVDMIKLRTVLTKLL